MLSTDFRNDDGSGKERVFTAESGCAVRPLKAFRLIFIARLIFCRLNAMFPLSNILILTISLK
jgi:hypothetical protein